MKFFIISFLFGVIQIILLKFLLQSVIKQKGKIAFLICIAKIALYAFVIAKYLFNYLNYFVYCGFGYIIGMVITAFAVFIFQTFIKKQ